MTKIIVGVCMPLSFAVNTAPASLRCEGARPSGRSVGMGILAQKNKLP